MNRTFVVCIALVAVLGFALTADAARTCRPKTCCVSTCEPATCAPAACEPAAEVTKAEPKKAAEGGEAKPKRAPRKLYDCKNSIIVKL